MDLSKIQLADTNYVADAMRNHRKILLLDTRSFMEYETDHISGSINIGGNRSFRRKFLSFQIHMDRLLRRLVEHYNTNTVTDDNPVLVAGQTPSLLVIYDHQSIDDLSQLRSDSFLLTLIGQLTRTSSSSSSSNSMLGGDRDVASSSSFKAFPILLLKDSYLTFKTNYPDLIWTNPRRMANEDIAPPPLTDGQLVIDQSQAIEQLLDECIMKECDEVFPISTLSLSPTSSRGDCIDSSSNDHVGSVPLPNNSRNGGGIRRAFTLPASATSPSPSSPCIIDCRRTVLSSSVAVAASSVKGEREGEEEVSLILPHLLLGNQTNAECEGVLQRHNITHVLSVCRAIPGISDSVVDEVRSTVITKLRIPVEDTSRARLLPHFDQAFVFLDDVRKSNGCALVHCVAGISRSATLVIAYLMKTRRMRMRDAYDFVKARRPCIAPNFNFLGQLIEYERELFTNSLSVSLVPAFPSPPTIECSTALTSAPLTAGSSLTAIKSSGVLLAPPCTSTQCITQPPPVPASAPKVSDANCPDTFPSSMTNVVRRLSPLRHIASAATNCNDPSSTLVSSTSSILPPIPPKPSVADTFSSPNSVLRRLPPLPRPANRPAVASAADCTTSSASTIHVRRLPPLPTYSATTVISKSKTSTLSITLTRPSLTNAAPATSISTCTAVASLPSNLCTSDTKRPRPSQLSLDNASKVNQHQPLRRQASLPCSLDNNNKAGNNIGSQETPLGDGNKRSRLSLFLPDLASRRRRPCSLTAQSNPCLNATASSNPAPLSFTSPSTTGDDATLRRLCTAPPSPADAFSLSLSIVGSSCMEQSPLLNLPPFPCSSPWSPTTTNSQPLPSSPFPCMSTDVVQSPVRRRYTAPSSPCCCSERAVNSPCIELSRRLATSPITTTANQPLPSFSCSSPTSSVMKPNDQRQCPSSLQLGTTSRSKSTTTTPTTTGDSLIWTRQLSQSAPLSVTPDNSTTTKVIDWSQLDRVENANVRRGSSIETNFQSLISSPT